MSRTNLDILINGERHQILIEPHWTLLHVLRTVVGGRTVYQAPNPGAHP